MDAIDKNSRPRGRAKRTLATLLAVVFALMVLAPAPVVAADPTSAQYETDVAQIGNDVAAAPGQEATAAEPAQGLQSKVVPALPFTGLDLIALVTVSLALLSLGFALRRLGTVRARA